MKLKTLLLGLGSAVATISPIVAVVSCGKDEVSKAKTTVTKTNITRSNEILNFDDVMINHGATSDEAIKHELTITKMQNKIKTGNAKGFIIDGHKYILDDFKKQEGNEVQHGLDVLNEQLSQYYPSTLEGSLQGLASTGKIVFEKTTFDLPNPGETFNILKDMPKAPKFTRWVASSDQLFLRDADSTESMDEVWWPIEGWKRPYSDQHINITFKVKLVPDIGYKIANDNLTTLTFRTTHASVSSDALLKTIKMTSKWDAVANKMVNTITQSGYTPENLKLTFNGKDTYSFDNSKLDEKINVHLTKLEGITYSEDQQFDYTITPSKTLMTATWGGSFATINGIKIDDANNRMPLKIGENTYYYHSGGTFGENIVGKLAVPKAVTTATSEEELKTWLATIPTPNHEILIKGSMIKYEYSMKLDASNNLVITNTKSHGQLTFAMFKTDSDLGPVSSVLKSGIPFYPTAEYKQDSHLVAEQVYDIALAPQMPKHHKLTLDEQGFYTVKDLTINNYATTKVADGVITGTIYLGHDSKYMTNNLLEAAVIQKMNVRLSFDETPQTHAATPSNEGPREMPGRPGMFVPPLIQHR